MTQQIAMEIVWTSVAFIAGFLARNGIRTLTLYKNYHDGFREGYYRAFLLFDAQTEERQENIRRRQ